MYTKEKFVLIKSGNSPYNYRISDKETRGYILFDNVQEVIEIIKKLIEEGAEIYETEEEFNKHYPPLTSEERKKMGQDFFIRAQKKIDDDTHHKP